MTGAAPAAPPRLRRPARAGLPLSLTPLVDVLLILVVFFLVTASYLDLRTIPLVQPAEAVPEPSSEPAGAAGTVPFVLVRLGADGRMTVRGRVVDPPGLSAVLAGQPGARVLVLPSPAASTQALVTVLDAAAAGGAGRVEVVRLAPDTGAAPEQEGSAP